MVNVMHILGSFGKGGAEMGVVRLVQQFQGSRELHHIVCSIGSDISMKSHLPTGVGCYCLNLDGRSFSAFLKISRIIKENRIDVVHVNNLAPWVDSAIGARLGKCSVIETFHGIETSFIEFSAVRKLLFKLAFNLSFRVTAVSQSAAILLRELTGIDSKDIEVIPNGVDTKFFVPCTNNQERLKIRKKKGLPEHGLLLGCVGALRPVKNHEGLIKAFNYAVRECSASDTYLLLVGSGQLEKQLRNLAHEVGLAKKVIFMGHRNDVRDILRVLDAFVLNSYTEGMSYAVLEAMACGLPVIGTRVGANPELIDDGKHGFLVKPGNIGLMSKALAQVIKNRDKLVIMGRAAREKVEKSYSIDKMVEAYRKLYVESASKRHKGNGKKR